MAHMTQEVEPWTSIWWAYSCSRSSLQRKSTTTMTRREQCKTRPELVSAGKTARRMILELRSDAMLAKQRLRQTPLLVISAENTLEIRIDEHSVINIVL